MRAVYSTSRMSSNTGCKQLVDQPASENRRPELAFDLVDVLARLQHRDDRRVGARPADAVLLERLDERSFVEARRRLRELLLGLDLLRLERLPFASAPAARRSTASSSLSAAPGAGCDGCSVRSLSSASLDLCAVDGQPAGELRHRSLGAEDVVARGDVHASCRRTPPASSARRRTGSRSGDTGRTGLASDTPGPTPAWYFIDVGPDRLVRVLRRGLHLVAIRPAPARTASPNCVLT